jgi:hypothetical protein
MKVCIVRWICMYVCIYKWIEPDCLNLAAMLQQLHGYVTTNMCQLLRHLHEIYCNIAMSCHDIVATLLWRLPLIYRYFVVILLHLCCIFATCLPRFLDFAANLLLIYHEFTITWVRVAAILTHDRRDFATHMYRNVSKFMKCIEK